MSMNCLVHPDLQREAEQIRPHLQVKRILAFSDGLIIELRWVAMEMLKFGRKLVEEERRGRRRCCMHDFCDNCRRIQR
jgi:hypothetical protein